MTRSGCLRFTISAIGLSAAFFLPIGRVAAQDGPARTPVAVALLAPEQMPAVDADIARQRQQSVARSAHIYGYTLDSTYSYREIACPYAAHDLVLAYESAQADGAISRFTAVVAREAKPASEDAAAVEIIPILRFGVTPFVAADASPHSVEVFNWAVAAAPVWRPAPDGRQAANEPILLRGLCYLAMVGAEPAALRSPYLEAVNVHAPAPTLEFLPRGKLRQQVTIRSGEDAYQVWALSFASSGKLESAERREHRDSNAAAHSQAAAAPPALARPTPAPPTVAPPVQPMATPTPSVAAALPPTVNYDPGKVAPPVSPAQGGGSSSAHELPPPPHRLIADSPQPPVRTIPASALPSPPHLPQ